MDEGNSFPRSYIEYVVSGSFEAFDGFDDSLDCVIDVCKVQEFSFSVDDRLLVSSGQFYEQRDHSITIIISTIDVGESEYDVIQSVTVVICVDHGFST